MQRETTSLARTALVRSAGACSNPLPMTSRLATATRAVYRRQTVLNTTARFWAVAFVALTESCGPPPCEETLTCPPPGHGAGGQGGGSGSSGGDAGVGGTPARGGGDSVGGHEANAAGRSGIAGHGNVGQGGESGASTTDADPVDAGAKGDDAGSAGTNDVNLAPRVVTISPHPDDVADPLDPIVIEFSEDIDPSSFSADTLTLLDGSTKVAGSIVHSGRTATFTPVDRLALLGAYELRVSASVRDLEGVPMKADYSSEVRIRDGAWTETTTLGNGSPPSAGVSANGRVLVGWGDESTLYATWYDAEDGWGAPKELGTCAQCQLGSDGANVAVNSSGDALVVYAADMGGLHARQFRKGSWDGSEQTVHASCDRWTYAMALAPTGEAHVVCATGSSSLPLHTDGNGDWLQSGASWSNAIFPVSLGFGPDGNGFAVWHDQGARFTQYDRSEGSWRAPATLSGSGATATGVSIAVGDDSEALAAWLDSDGVVASVFHPNQGWGSVVAVDVNSTGNVPAVAAAGGDYAVAWVRDSRVYVNRYTGGAWQGNVLVSDRSVEVDATYPPALAGDAGGNFLLIWRAGTGFFTDITYSRYARTTDTWTTPAKVTTSQTNYGYPPEILGVGANGVGAVACTAGLDESDPTAGKVIFFQ